MVKYIPTNFHILQDAVVVNLWTENQSNPPETQSQTISSDIQ